MRPYLDLLQRILDEGTWTENRTGVRTLGVFGHRLAFDLADGFPLVTTKKVHFKSVVTELLFFLRGYTDVRWLQERKCRIWNEWATPEQCAKRGLEPGDLGPVYGWQWRHFGAEYRGTKGDDGVDYDGQGVDQLAWVLRELRENGDSRQIVLSAWNPVDRPRQALPPCHVLVHFRARNGKLDASMFQRSCDVFLGVPFNIASYALLVHLVARAVGLEPGTFVHFLSDAHLYENHLDQVRTQLAREPRPRPRLEIAGPVREPWDVTADDIALFDYDPHPALRGEVAV